MRDTADFLTATIPGVPELPPPRPTVAQRREAAGFAGPRERSDSCRHCRHRRDVLKGTGGVCESFIVRCSLHDFPTELGAVCDHYSPKRGGASA